MPELNRQLIRASEKGDLALVKSLVEQGADVHVDKEGALIWAASSGQLEVVKYLVEECGADINTKDQEGCSILLNTIVTGQVEVIRFLLEAGAKAEDKELNLMLEKGILDKLVNAGMVHNLFSTWKKNYAEVK